MKKFYSILTILFFFCFSFSFSYSQKIHTTNEILKLLTNSNIKYQIQQLDKPVLCKDYSDKLNYNESYRVITDSGIILSNFKSNEPAQPRLQKAESYFQAGDIDDALIWYKSTLEADSSLYFVMTYIGQIYEKKKDFKNSIVWYKKAISKNYIDYMAHWFLADNYMSTTNSINSLDEIVIARILNRNNLRIKKSMNYIFLKNKRDTDDWCFNPQIVIKKTSDRVVSIDMENKWIGYAMAKALWMFEPGYSESMGVRKGQHSTLEDRECLIALIVAEVNAKTNIKNDPQLRILKEAADKNFLDEYIMYELILPQTPGYALQMSEKTILGIKDYILNVRNKKY